MIYREATPSDASAIAVLHALSWRENYRGAYLDSFLDGDVLDDRLLVWRERLSTPATNQFVVVAEDDGDMVGFICAYGAEDEQWGTLLDNLHVRPEGQGKGVGARLVAEVGAWCRQNYPDRPLYLWVLEQNVKAQQFYSRLGATDRGGERSVPPGGGQISGRRYVWSAASEVPEVEER